MCIDLWNDSTTCVLVREMSRRNKTDAFEVRWGVRDVPVSLKQKIDNKWKYQSVRITMKWCGWRMIVIKDVWVDVYVMWSEMGKWRVCHVMIGSEHSISWVVGVGTGYTYRLFCNKTYLERLGPMIATLSEYTGLSSTCILDTALMWKEDDKSTVSISVLLNEAELICIWMYGIHINNIVHCIAYIVIR